MIIIIPLYIFLFLFFIVLTVFAAFVIINFYHIIGSGTFTFGSFLMTFLTAVATAAVLYQTYLFLQGTDWQQTITLFNSSWITAIFPAPTL